MPSPISGTSVPSVFSFEFESQPVRALLIDDQPWFVAADVCAALKIENVTQAVQRLDDDERSMFNIGRQGDTNIINDSGLYTLTLRCRDAVKPGSLPHRFRKKVTSEILPAIRKTGRYETKQAKHLNARLEIEVRPDTESYYCISGVNKANAPALLSAIAIASYEIAEIAQREHPAYFPKQVSKHEAAFALGNAAFGRFAS